MRTSRRGEDPKKKSNGVEPPQKQYTIDDVWKNEEVKARNLAKKKQYESDLASYGEKVKAYSKLEPKGTRDLQTFFKGGGRYLSPSELESWNKERQQSGTERDLFKAKKVYVSKDYGKEQSGSPMKGSKGTYAGYKGTFHEWLGEPEKPSSPVYEKEESIDVRKIPMERLPLLKSKISSKNKELSISSGKTASIDKSDWEEPKGGVKMRSKVVKPYNVKAGEYAKERIKYGLKKLTGEAPGLRPGVIKQKEALIQGRVGREGKQAKAYFGGGFENQPVSTIKEREALLRAGKSEIKSAISEAKKSGNKEKVAAYRTAKKEYGSEIKQTKMASKYIKKLGREYTGVSAGQKLDNTGKIKAYTPEAMAGFVGSKKDVVKEINPKRRK